MTQNSADGLHYISPAVPPERMLANMRSAIARGLPQVQRYKPHDLVLSVAGGGPSLEDTYDELNGCIAAVNGSLRWLLEHGVSPAQTNVFCAAMDAGEHIADLIVAHPDVRYYICSICDPKVFDKLQGCDVRLWHITPNSTEDPDGVRAVLDEAYDGTWFAVGGGCTMGLRWVDLGYVLGFRRFRLHGMDSSFRGRSTHAYPDRADSKEWVEFKGRMTRPNFLAQVYDFMQIPSRFAESNLDDIGIEVLGDGLLQDEWRRACQSSITTDAGITTTSSTAYGAPTKKSSECGLTRENGTIPTICCVNTTTKYGPEYVTRLRDGVARHLRTPHDFVCFTPAQIDGVHCEPLPADLPGWWAKIGLFKLKRPLIYFDLDVLITGDLTPLLEWKGFGILDDWWKPGFNSSVMKLAGDETRVWHNFTPDVMERYNSVGDQGWITDWFPPNQKTFPREWFPSYKADHCVDGPPDDAMAVVFHGYPKPSDLGGWVADAWRGYEIERPEYPAAGPAAQATIRTGTDIKEIA